MFQHLKYTCAFIVIALAGFAGCSTSSNTPAPENAVATKPAVIHFADLGGIEDWRATSNEELYVQGRTNQWYKATFNAPCSSLVFANTIAFVTEPTGDLDKFSAVIVDDQRCYFRTFKEVDEPPA